MSTTRAQKKAEQENAFKHLLDMVLEEKPDSNLRKSLAKLRIDPID